MKSDNMKSGIEQAPARSLLNALGYTKEEQKRPMVGIVSSYNEIVPGHMHLDKLVEAVKIGVAMAGGTPVVFPAIAVCDGIAMGHIGMKYSLVTRDLIADSTECMAVAHQFDALVMIPNCDKNVPGLLMAAARVNVPTVFVSGGPMLAGKVNGCKTSLSSMFEAVGSYAAGTMTEEDVLSILRFLLWNVYCKFHELFDRSDRNGASRKRYDSCANVKKNSVGKNGGYAGNGNVEERYQAERYHDGRSIYECIDYGYGTWMFY